MIIGQTPLAYTKNLSASSRRTEAVEIVSVLFTTETRTILVDAFELTVAHDLSVRVVGFERAEEGNQGCTLGGSASVARATFLV